MSHVSVTPPAIVQSASFPFASCVLPNACPHVASVGG
jgi:hypothetical protein